MSKSETERLQMREVPTRIEFRDEVLGWLSSHPHWREKQRRFWQWLYSLPFIAVMVFVVLGLFFRLDNFFSLLQSSGRWLVIGAAVWAFFAAANVTFALVARWGELQRTKLGQAGSNADHWPLDPLILFVGLIVGAAIPISLFYCAFLPPWVRLLSTLMAVLPPFALMAAMSYLGRSPDKTERRDWLIVLASLAMGVLALTLIHDLAKIWNKGAVASFLGQAIPFYARLGQLFLGVVTLLPLSFMLFVAWRVWRRPIKYADDEQETPPEVVPAKPSFFRRLGTFLTGIFKPRAVRKPPPAPSSETPPAWLAEILANLPEGVAVARAEPQPIIAHEVSDLDPDPAWQFIFCGHNPTTDQRDALLRFIQGYEEMVGLREAPPGVTGTEQNGDLIIEGEHGSGRTFLLQACALFAAFVRGQHVLVLTPDSARQRAWCERLDQFLRQNHLHYYLTAESLTEKSLAAWLHTGKPMPNIVVATVDGFERHFYGNEVRAGQPFERLRALLSLLEVVLVDDVTDFPATLRSHLPFIVDKHRLVLAAESLKLQVAWVLPPLAPLGRDAMVARLVTAYGGFQWKQNVRRLRPRQCGPAWRVDLVAENVPAAIGPLAVECLKKDLEVLIYNRGADPTELKSQRDTLLQQAGKERGLTMVGDLDQPFEDAGEIAAAFYQVAVDSDQCLALRLRAGTDGTVVFSLAPTGETHERRPEGIVPVLADRTARSLLLGHLKSGLRFITPHTPIELGVWGQFGITPAAPAGRPDLHADLAIALGFDMPEDHSKAYLQRLSKLMWVESGHQLFAPVEPWQFPAPGEAIYRAPDGEPRLYLARPFDESAALANPVGHWHDHAGLDAGTTDLAHFTELRHVFNGNVLAAETVRQEDQRTVIQGIRSHGAGDDPIFPVLDLDWTLPAENRLTWLGGGAEDGLVWLRVEEPQNVEIVARLVGRFDEYGRATPLPPVQFRYRASLTTVVLGPKETEPDELQNTFGALVARRWHTASDPRFSAALTGALSYAFQQRLPGFAFYARCAAFTLTENDAGGIILWIIEPATSGHTVGKVFKSLLRRRDERAGFFESVHWFLEQQGFASDAAAFLRRFARVAYHHADMGAGHPNLLQYIGYVRDRARQT